MDNYYIYILELLGDEEENTRYYVGKTKQLARRMTDQFNGNKRSAENVANSKVKSVVALFEIDGSVIKKLGSSRKDSITSKIENDVTNQLKMTNSLSEIRGGSDHNPWGISDVIGLDISGIDNIENLSYDKIMTDKVNNIFDTDREIISILDFYFI